MKCLNFRQNRCGQAITEFILGMMIMVSFFFFFIKMAVVFAIGNYVHYSTFMAARAYMSSASTIDAQEENGTQVLSQMLGGRWKKIIKPEGSGGSIPGGYVGPGKIFADQPLNYWNQGATFSYSSKLELYPFSDEGIAVNLKLTSESWMPRDESRSETAEAVNKIKAAASGAASVQGGVSKVVWDEN